MVLSLPIEVQEEINRHNVLSFDQLSLEHQAVIWAREYLMQSICYDMAIALRSIVESGGIRVGALEGFVASAVVIEDKAYIVLSNKYAEYNNDGEIMASLVQEIGNCIEPKRSDDENASRAQKALDWLRVKQGRQTPKNSIISTAVQIRGRDKKEAQ